MTKKYNINHQTYTPTELLEQCAKVVQEEDLPTWKKEAWSFMAEWLDDGDYVQLKTSGSTGDAKRIDVEKKYMRNSAQMTIRFLKLRPGSVALLCLSAAYVAGKMMIVRAFEGGLDLLLREPSGNPLVGLDEKIHFAAMIPLQVQKSLDEHGPESVQNMTHLIIGGAAVSETLSQRVRPLRNAVWATYGMTETLSHIALRRLSGTDASAVFTPMDGVALSTDERHCLSIDAPHLSPDTIVTNDVVILNDDQSFEYIGRYDNVINSGGVKLMPDSIEQKLVPFIADRFMVSSIPDDRLGQKLVLVIETSHGEDYDWTILQTQIAKVLTAVERPRELFCIPAFDETRSGKLKRNTPF